MRHGYKDSRNIERGITLFREGGSWMARSAAYVEAFGTDTIPTAFTEYENEYAVVYAIRRLNPGVIVSVRD